MIKCKTCKVSKTDDCFYKNKNNKLFSSCKICQDLITRKSHKTKKYKDNRKNYLSKPDVLVRTKAYKKNWYLNNKEKYKAHFIVFTAIKKGVLIKMPCIKCGGSAEAHHEDYSKPLDVIWLCRQHHIELHASRRKKQLQ